MIFLTGGERLTCLQCFTYNDWNAVAAIQAICIYFLLRLSETDSEATDFDIPLILTMRVRTIVRRPISELVAE